MRVQNRHGREVGYKVLGKVPSIESLMSAASAEFDFLSQETLTTEKVFADTHRLMAMNESIAKYVTENQKYVLGPRSLELFMMVQTQLDWLCSLYPTSRPFIVQCATLPCNKTLLWHIDSYIYQSLSHKIHIPLITNPFATYEFMQMKLERKVFFQVGNAYEINNIWMHRSSNFGRTARTHIIIDMLEEEGFQRLESGEDIIFTHDSKNKAVELEYFK